MSLKVGSFILGIEQNTALYLLGNPAQIKYGSNCVCGSVRTVLKQP